MLKQSNKDGFCTLEMHVEHRKSIAIEFCDIFTYLANNADAKKIVFIDSIVLANQGGFLALESQDSNLLLVPTNVNESNKDFESLLAILSVMEMNGVGRRGDQIIAVGGGSLLDIVSLAASIFRRGITVVKVPTTLLAIVDAAIGIKTGINYLGQRNRIGSYHFDFSVITDPKLMKGLHRGLVRQGLGEVFKIAIIKSKELFNKLNHHIDKLEDVSFYMTNEGLQLLKLSMLLMLDELHENPREDNLMRCVDFGHSFSPLVEMESLRRSGTRSLPHGYSVAFDCLLTATLSMKRGRLSDGDYKSILDLYRPFDFCLYNDIYSDTNLLWASFMEMTKHRGGNQNLPIPIAIGEYAFLQDVSFEEVRDCSDVLKKLAMP